MKYEIFKDVVMVQGHSAVLLLQVGSTVLCLGDSGRRDEGSILEIRLFAPLAEKMISIKLRVPYKLRMLWYRQPFKRCAQCGKFVFSFHNSVVFCSEECCDNWVPF